MNPDKPLDLRSLRLRDAIGSNFSPLLPGHEWIFVAASDLEGLIAQLSLGDKQSMPHVGEVLIKAAVDRQKVANGTLKRALAKANSFLSERGFAELTRQEAEDLCRVTFQSAPARSAAKSPKTQYLPPRFGELSAN